MTNYDKHCEGIRRMIEREIRNRFAGVVDFCPWIHPLNTVSNCIMLSLDGGPQYKFSLTGDGQLEVAEIIRTNWINLQVKVGQKLTWDGLQALILKAKYYQAFSKNTLKRM